METESAANTLAALAQGARLRVFRLLVKAGADGLAAGEIARRLGAPPNTTSAHLKVLSHAGLVRSRREGRSIIYTAGFERMAALLSFLVEDCCEGSMAVCRPLVTAVARATCR